MEGLNQDDDTYEHAVDILMELGYDPNDEV